LIWKAELSANSPTKCVLDLAMPWNWCRFAVDKIDEDVMSGAMTQQLASGIFTVRE
jgi:hypothetical protein